jgi:hypothetical protein
VALWVIRPKEILEDAHGHEDGCWPQAAAGR